MGLIRAAKNALGSVLADQWLEYFYCDALPSDVLVMKAKKKVNSKKGNSKGSDNIISNGSVIAVNKGQCMMIVDQGQVVEFCAEDGEFVYDSSSEPSIFSGDLGESVVASFKKVAKRMAYGGNTGHDQRVYYFNTKEIMHNLFGTATPIDFHIVSPRTGYEMETTVRCNGEYTFQIVDPITFYEKVCGNVTDVYSKSAGEGINLMSMMKRELLTKLPTALAKIAAEGVLPYQVAGRAEEIAGYLREALTEPWTEMRGIEVVSMTIECSTSAEDREKINKWNDMVMLTSSGMQEAAKTEAMTEMIKNAKIGGGNGGGNGMDAMMGMFSVNMMQNMMSNGGMMGGNAQAPQGQQMQSNPQMQPQGAILGWTCSCGHADNRGKFCAECGSPKPAEAGWTCTCGSVNQGKFCSNCGSKKPAGAPMYKCDKCGWEPEDPTNPPKFCPECGDVFDENDIQ
ncbi:MAG: SPFH domain-containing protein [Lachnospiraceae bacterium]|nr:SPFH domain-containing protein [Lachnospiraceae bacterium]